MEMIVKLTCEKDITDFLEWYQSRKSEKEAFEPTDIFNAGLSHRAANALKTAGYDTFDEAATLNEAKLRGIGGIGKKMQREITAKAKQWKC